MIDKNDLHIRPADEVYENATSYIIEQYTNYLLESAQEGYLPGITPTVIESLSRSFVKEHALFLAHHMSDSINTHMEWKERELCSKMRQRPFDRLLVKRFSKWFPKNGMLNVENDEVFSRRMLPGLFKALAMMAGVGPQKRAEQRIDHYWSEIVDEKGDMASWGDLYIHTPSNDVIDTYLSEIAISFDHFDERLEWFTRAINNGLGQSDKYAFEGDGVWAWTLNSKSALKLLRTLYSPISKKVHDDELRKHFEEGKDANHINHTYMMLDELAKRQH